MSRWIPCHLAEVVQWAKGRTVESSDVKPAIEEVIFTDGSAVRVYYMDALGKAWVQCEYTKRYADE